MQQASNQSGRPAGIASRVRETAGLAQHAGTSSGALTADFALLSSFFEKIGYNVYTKSLESQVAAECDMVPLTDQYGRPEQE